MLREIYFLDLLGTFTFAAYGAYVAQRKEFDIFGIFACAFLTALGGGTLREFVLGNIPFYFFDNNYVYAIIGGAAFSIFVYHRFERLNRYMLVVDAVGLATFALIGATAAKQAQLGAFAVVFLATITAVGGGLLRDVSIREVPRIFYRDFYASPAIFLGVVYAVFGRYRQHSVFIWSVVTCTFLLRLAAIYFKLHLWGPRRKKAPDAPGE
ncbi:MAG: trimeric intracellular cation channel family protein [Sedimentisphaerales bacterium]|nr:trimeric intracellular cation channel family protein [Sedimentisphaerales bacterium]